MIVRKEDLIAALQAIEGNPFVVIEKDGGDYWGTYREFPQLEVEKVYSIVGDPVTALFVGHPGDTSGESKFHDVTDQQNRYVVLR